MGLFLLVLYGALITITIWMWAEGKGGPQDLIIPAFYLFTMRPSTRARGETWRAVLEVIMKVAERSPRPELHRLLPDLQSIARDRILTHPEAREVARSAAERIQVLTSVIQDLPVPAGAEPVSAESLPVPSRRAPQPGGEAQIELECGRR